MPRQSFEFRCTECGKYFDVVLNTSLNGEYRIHCPKCNHIHYRKLKDGQITEDRFDTNKNSFLIEDIYPMKSSCRDEKKEKPEMVEHTGKGFLSRLWAEFSGVNA